MRVIVILALFLMGCSAIIPDWNARTWGNINLTPGYYTWTAPRHRMQTTKDHCDVTLFTRANHVKPLEIQIRRALDTFDSDPTNSLKTEWVLPYGRHTFKVWFVRDGETEAYQETWFQCAASRPSGTMRGAQL